MKSFTIGFFAIILSASLSFAEAEVGKMAPEFSLKGNDGKTYSSKDLKGKYVVLEWFNNDCPYVDKHYHESKRNMQNLQKDWISKAKTEKKDLVWLAVVSSAPGKQGHVTAEEATRIRDEERNAHMTAILMDPTGKVGKAYGAKTTPHMYVISPDGKLQYNGAIDDKPSARVSSLDGATNYVSAALTSLFAEKAVASSSTSPYGCSVKYK